MFKLIFFLTIPLLLFANQYPHFTQKDLLYLEKRYGSIVKNRVYDYQKTINALSSSEKIKQLNKVNIYLNQLLPQYDAITQEKEDYWATPKEFLIHGYGDCEDYVIIKYFSLLKLGFKKEKFFFTIVREKYTGGNHMVLSYFPKPGESPLILDNLSFRILNLKQRKDLQAKLFINTQGVFKLSKFSKLKKTPYQSFEFLQLMKKINSNF